MLGAGQVLGGGQMADPRKAYLLPLGGGGTFEQSLGRFCRQEILRESSRRIQRGLVVGRNEVAG